MNFNEFQAQVRTEMQEQFPQLQFGLQEVNKLQGQSYKGLSVKPEGSNIAATLNLEPFYERLNKGASLRSVMGEISRTVAEAQSHMPQVDTDMLTDYGQMKDKLVIQLLPQKGNEERLAQIPHQKIEDMAVVYRFELEQNDQGTSSILVTKNMLQNYGISEQQLQADAMEAAVKNHPASLRNMNDVLGEMLGGMVPDEPALLWVATVQGGQNGACAIQYPGFLEQAAETLKGNFFVLPSSVHEVLLVADDGTVQLPDLEQMVRDVNETEVALVDRLSDTVFHYDSESHVFESARNAQMRASMMEEAVLADEPALALAQESETITVLLVEPEKHPQVVQIGTELSDLQAAVGGYIEVVYPFDDPVGLIVNEEGKLNGLPLNRALYDEDGQISDVVAGSFLVTGLTEDSFGSLTQEQISKYEQTFHRPETFIKMGRSVMAIPIPDEVLDAKDAAKAAEEIADKPKHRKPDHDSH